MSMAKINLISRPRSCLVKINKKKKLEKEKTMKLTTSHCCTNSNCLVLLENKSSIGSIDDVYTAHRSMFVQTNKFILFDHRILFNAKKFCKSLIYR